MARNASPDAPVVGIQFHCPEVMVMEVYRTLNEQGIPQDMAYVTVKFKDGGEFKFGTDQIPQGTEDQLVWQRVSVSGVLRGRRFGKDQSLQTVGTLTLAPVGHSA